MIDYYIAFWNMVLPKKTGPRTEAELAEISATYQRMMHKHVDWENS